MCGALHAVSQYSSTLGLPRSRTCTDPGTQKGHNISAAIAGPISLRAMMLCVSACSVKSNRSPPGSSVRGTVQARILEWVAVSFSSGSSRPRDRTCTCSTGRQILYCSEAPIRALIGSNQPEKEVNQKRARTSQSWTTHVFTVDITHKANERNILTSTLVRLLGKFQTTGTHLLVHTCKCTCYINILRTNYGKAKRCTGREAGDAPS